MSAIVLYDDPSATTQDARIAGMAEAGAKIRAEAPGVTNPNQAKAVVNEIVETFVDAADKHAVLEVIGGDLPIGSKIGDNFDLGAKKLKLKGEVDDEQNNLYQMTSVIPARATPTNSWAYLSDRVVPDMRVLIATYDSDPTDANKVRLEDYLIATFAFTRCR